MPKFSLLDVLPSVFLFARRLSLAGHLQNGPSQKPSESLTAAIVCETKHYQVGVASLWPLATIDGAETLYTCMNKSWYEYEVGWVQ